MKKVINIICALVGVAAIIAGVLFIAMPPTDFGSTNRANGASFGADYYTYQYTATQYAANNTASTAKNLEEMAHVNALYVGVGFILAGLLITLHYIGKCAEDAHTGVSTVNPVPQPITPYDTEANQDGAVAGYGTDADFVPYSDRPDVQPPEAPVDVQPQVTPVEPGEIPANDETAE